MRSEDVIERASALSKEELVAVVSELVAQFGDRAWSVLERARPASAEGSVCTAADPSEYSAGKALNVPGNEEAAVASIVTPVGDPKLRGKVAKQSKLDKQKKNFDINKFHQRHVALQIEYDGTAYFGFASQDLEETVENHLFQSLEKLNLISNRKVCNYSRCGRTDKGVSALRQVVALKMRSAMPLSLTPDQFPTHPEDSVMVSVAAKPSSKTDEGTPTQTLPSTKEVKEMDYCTMLNNCLPSNIRVISWAPVTDEFSARFSAAYRQYRYFFIKKDLNIAAMQDAASRLLGEHDFRNMCKLDIENVTNFRREVFSAEIKCFHRLGGDVDEASDVYMLEIKGIAFLWHMVRCIMAVLFLVGQGLESADVVDQLLDVEAHPAKPGYPMAVDYPLVLHDCGFEKLIFSAQVKTLWQLTAHYQNKYDEELIAAMRTKNAMEYLHGQLVRRADVMTYLEYIRENKKRALQRVADKGIKLAPESCDSSSGVKRKRADEEPDGPSNVDGDEQGELLSWRAALALIQQCSGQLPCLLAPANVHVPLMQRNVEEAYNDKVQKLAGHKKERLERHLHLSAAAKDTTPLFFQKMRQQGSL